ncbi:MAG TPA: response regulator [Methanospirillum sp.]|nr:response regulator [Methanospirillum sp.]
MISILYVDANPVYRITTKQFLERLGGFTVTPALSGKEALVILSSESFDIIISDYTLPDMDGIVLFRQIKEANDLIPFILVSDSITNMMQTRAKEFGVDYVLSKKGSPVIVFEELSHKIRRSVKRRRREHAFREQSLKIKAEEKERWVIDYDGYTRSGGEEIAGLLMYPLAEIQSTSIFSFMDEPGRITGTQIFEGISNLPEKTCEFDLLRSDKSRIVIQMNLVPVTEKDQRQTIECTNITDITGIKSILKTLQSYEEQCCLIAENIKEIIWILDTVTMKFTYMNSSVIQMLGYTPGKILSRQIDHTLVTDHPESLPDIIWRRVMNHLSEDEPVTFYIDEIRLPAHEQSPILTNVISAFYLNRETDHIEARGIIRECAPVTSTISHTWSGEKIIGNLSVMQEFIIQNLETIPPERGLSLIRTIELLIFAINHQVSFTHNPEALIEMFADMQNHHAL